MLDFYCYATANIGQNFFFGGGGADCEVKALN